MVIKQDKCQNEDFNVFVTDIINAVARTYEIPPEVLTHTFKTNCSASCSAAIDKSQC